MYRVPGVYYEPRPRAAEPPTVRTDVAGFVGFEPRVRDGSTASALTAAGHAFRVDVSEFQLVVDGVRARVPQSVDLVLSQDPGSIPIASGQAIRYALAAAATGGELHRLLVVAGTAAPAGTEAAPSDPAITAAAGTRSWMRIADVSVRRIGSTAYLTVFPARALAMTRCDDWRDFVLAFGAPSDDGTLLGPAVRAFFANGGRRCWVSTVRRPDFTDADQLRLARADFVGIAGSSEEETTGLERLLLSEEVTLVDVPDLYARRTVRAGSTVPLPGTEADACFHPCSEYGPRGVATATGTTAAWETIFTSSPPWDGTNTNDVFETQRALLARVIAVRWRAMLLLSVPLVPDGGAGPAVPPVAADAEAWRAQFHRLVTTAGFATTEEMAAGALYWPWVWEQERVDSEPALLAPSGYAAGVFARRDSARGPIVSPANESLRQVVALASPVSDEDNARLYVPDPDAGGFTPPATNVLRAFPGRGIELWGARTLSTETWLRFVSVRRTLTAIEMRMKAILDTLLFEPHSPLLWIQVSAAGIGVLMPLWEAGALRGSSPEEAFFVRCDQTVNTVEDIAAGRLTVEIGVAIAAPAEFIVFRVGRSENVIEVLEQ